MGAPRLPERTRQKLLALVGEDRPDPRRLINRLQQLRRVDDVPACAEALRMLAHLDLPDDQAERLLESILRHRAEVGRSLGRDPGLRVAAVDYLSNVEPLLTNPKIVEMSLFEQTERSAVTDPLTGLFNRRYFRTAIRREVRRSRRYKLRFSLLMLDLDLFKRINDEYGHMFGDLVLRRVASAVRRGVREADVACRYGGEEFAVVLPETDRLGCYTAAERIRRRVETSFAERAVGGRKVRLTVSGGIAAFPDDGPDVAALVGRADESLYQAKTAGRNCIRMHPAERRRSVRYPARPSARVGILHVQPDQLRRAQAIDLSLYGALLETDTPYRPADPVRLVLGGEDAPGTVEAWVVDGEVVRVELGRGPAAGVRIGVAFEQPILEEQLRSQVLSAFSSAGTAGGAP